MEIDVTCGLHLGDHLSHFLFIIEMEELCVSMDRAKGGLFKGIILLHSGPHISHIFYVDGFLFLGSPSKRNIQNLSDIIKWFEKASGFRISFRKSTFTGTRVDDLNIASYASLRKCRYGKPSFKYLGLLVGYSMKYRRIGSL